MNVEQVLEVLSVNAGLTGARLPADGVQSGDPKRDVKKIAVSWRATVGCVREAAAAGCDLILTREPIYWQDSNKRAEGAMGMRALPLDQTLGYKAKSEFLAKQNLAVARTFELWEGDQSRSLVGLLDALRAPSGRRIEIPSVVGTPKAAVTKIPSSTLSSFVGACRKKLSAQSIRVLGDRNAKISSIAVLPGYLTVPDIMKIAETPGVDAIVTGDACEWEAFEYAEDWITAGHGRALVMLGLSNSLDPGAREFAKWVQTAVPDIPTSYIPAGDPMIPVHTETPKW